jgi:hypothetical protein
MKVVSTWSLARRLAKATPGAADNRMAYLLGLRELGHDVCLFEEVEPEECFDAAGQPVPFEHWAGREYFERVARSYGVWPDACLLYDGGRQTHGLSLREAIRRAQEADVLLDIGVTLRNRELAGRIPCRVYVDEAPAKTQVFHETYGIDQGLDDHQFFFSVGLNVGSPGCDVPTCGKRWHGIVHPVVLSSWPVANERPGERFTTVSNWGSRETFVLNGRYSGDKADNWKAFLGLPARAARPLEVALHLENGWQGDAALFRDRGWVVADAQRLGTLDDYRRYIAASRGELSVANPRYVALRTGWTSDRTARYLATGKPAVVQSTAIEGHLPTGAGLLTFSTPDEACAALDEVESAYPAHCRAARELAEEFFDARKVLENMLTVIGAS